MIQKTISPEEKQKPAINTDYLSPEKKLAAFPEDGVEQYVPWKNRNLTHPLGVMGALFHMVKGSLGSGILSMPVAFKNGGLWVSLVGAIFIGIVYTHCIHILVYSCQMLCVRIKRPRLEFAEIAEAAFYTGPFKWQRYTPLAKQAVDVSLFLGYYCCCIVYVLFTATSLKQVVEYNYEITVDVRLYILAITVVLVPLGLIRNLKFLVPFSFLAICCLMFGCGYVLYEIFQDIPPLSSRPAFTSFTRLPLFLSTIMFAVDGIGTVFPIENNMKNPKKFLGCPGVLNIGMVWLMTLYCAMGFFGYLSFGDATAASITLNISSSFWGQVVKMMVTVNVLCSFGLFLYVPCEIAWRKLRPNVKSRKTFYYYCMRLILIFGTVVLAAVVPDLETFVGLVGAICSSTLILFFPPIIELVTFWEDEVYMGRYRWRVYKNLLILLMWLVILVSGTQSSLSEIIALYQ